MDDLTVKFAKEIAMTTMVESSVVNEIKTKRYH